MKEEPRPYAVSIAWIARKLRSNRKLVNDQLMKPGSPRPVQIGNRLKYRLVDIERLFPGIFSHQ
jgi:hypothetical protein